MGTTGKTKREKGVEFKTPLATALWPKLAVADTKFATAEKPHGHYNIGVILPMSDPSVAKMIDALEALRQEALAEGQAQCKPGKKVKEAQYGWSPETDEQGQETGNVILNLKKPGAFSREDGTVVPMQVDVFDTAGVKLSKAQKEKIGSGSKVKAIFEAGKFSTGLGSGVSLRLMAVQLVDLVTFGSRSADEYGFETTGGGYVAQSEGPSFDTAEDDAPSAPSSANASDDGDI